jgi:hypothetical protein
MKSVRVSGSCRLQPGHPGHTMSYRRHRAGWKFFTGARPRAATSDSFCGRGSASITTGPASPPRRSSPSWSGLRCASPAMSERAGPSVGRPVRAGASGRVGSGGRAERPARGGRPDAEQTGHEPGRPRSPRAGGSAAVAGGAAVALRRARGPDARGTAARRPRRTTSRRYLGLPLWSRAWRVGSNGAESWNKLLVDSRFEPSCRFLER